MLIFLYIAFCCVFCCFQESLESTRIQTPKLLVWPGRVNSEVLSNISPTHAQTQVKSKTSQQTYNVSSTIHNGMFSVHIHTKSPVASRKMDTHLVQLSQHTLHLSAGHCTLRSLIPMPAIKLGQQLSEHFMICIITSAWGHKLLNFYTALQSGILRITTIFAAKRTVQCKVKAQKCWTPQKWTEKERKKGGEKKKKKGPLCLNLSQKRRKSQPTITTKTHNVIMKMQPACITVDPLLPWEGKRPCVL